MPRNTFHESGGGQSVARAALRHGEAHDAIDRSHSRSTLEVLSDDAVRQEDQRAERSTLIEALCESKVIARPEPVHAAVLLRTDRRGCGRLVELNDGSTRLGRSFEVEARFEDDSVSRSHAEISVDRGHYFITDLGSANGTFVNGQRVQSAALRDGCVIQLGSRVSFRFSLLEEDERQALGRLYELGHYDPLTRVHNRRFLGQHLSAELAFAERHRTSISVVLFDIDHFKRINDEHGHQVGDQVLERVASLAAQEIRTEDVIARYGGEEFMVVLRQTPVDGAAALAERIRRAVSGSRIETESASVEVTLSAGCASLACPGVSDVTELIRLADQRLYRAKGDGRDRVVSGEARLRSVPPVAPVAQPAVGTGSEEPDGPPSRVHRVDRAARAFEALDEELKLVVGLHYQECCSFAEIAAVLDVSEQWVSDRFRVAMEQLNAA